MLGITLQWTSKFPFQGEAILGDPGATSRDDVIFDNVIFRRESSRQLVK